MNRRTFVKSAAATTALCMTKPTWAADERTQGPSDDEILSQPKTASRNIAKATAS